MPLPPDHAVLVGSQHRRRIAAEVDRQSEAGGGDGHLDGTRQAQGDQLGQHAVPTALRLEHHHRGEIQMVPDVAETSAGMQGDRQAGVGQPAVDAGSPDVGNEAVLPSVVHDIRRRRGRRDACHGEQQEEDATPHWNLLIYNDAYFSSRSLACRYVTLRVVTPMCGAA